VTFCPSINTSPDEGAIRPSSILSKVVLPQPLAPRMLTNSDAWICREIFERTESGSVLLPANSLQIRLASSFSCTLAPVSGLELEVPPGCNSSFDVLEQCNAYDARGCKYEYADEHTGHIESLA
jgi:hypothetical protein